MVFLTIMFFVFFYQTPSLLKKHKRRVIHGCVASLVRYRQHHRTFLFKTQRGKLLLSIYGYHYRLQPNQCWQLFVSLSPDHNIKHFAFNYKNYLQEHGIVATGYVLSSTKNRHLGQRNNFILALRDRINRAIYFNGNKDKRFIQALTIGNRDDFTTADWSMLQVTGTNHLLAISGLHVGFIAGFIFLVVRLLWRLCPSLAFILPSKIAGSFCAWWVCFFYSLLAGFSLPTQRAMLMLTILLLAIMLRRPLRHWYSWILALVIIMCVNPFVIKDASFYLSFAAVAALLLSKPATGWLQHLWRPQWIVMIGVLPFSLYFYHQFSMVSLFANIVTIPIVAFIALPLCLLLNSLLILHFKHLAQFVLFCAEKVIAVVIFILHCFASLPYANVTVNDFSWWACLLLVFVVFSLLYWLPRLTYKEK